MITIIVLSILLLVSLIFGVSSYIAFRKESGLRAIQESALMQASKQLRSVQRDTPEGKTYVVTYRFSDSDYLKDEKKMVYDAKTRLLSVLVRKIGKDIAPEEIVEDGRFVGYRYELEVTRQKK